jgi:hypothetical protein
MPEEKPAPKPDENKCWDPGRVNAHTSQLISAAIIASACDDGQDEEMEESPRTELDSHANMVVVGKHCLIVEWTGRTAIVNPFTPDYEALTEVPIVDAAIMYECHFSGKNYILLVRNALHVPAMTTITTLLCVIACAAYHLLPLLSCLG